MPRSAAAVLLMVIAIVPFIGGCGARTPMPTAGVEMPMSSPEPGEPPQEAVPPRRDREAEELAALAEARARAEMESQRQSDSEARLLAERREAARLAELYRMTPPTSAAPEPGLPVGSPAPVDVPNPNVARGSAFDQVRVFYATDRKATALGTFGSGRGEGITYGGLFVSVPRAHEVGAIERPSIWRLEFSEDPRKHMMIMRRTERDRDAFLGDIRETMRRGGVDASFVFVHGYNVAFDDAALRTAQITYDLDFHGAPVFYSWPSQATIEGYTTDENNVEWSQTNLKAFLLDYAQHSGAQDIYLIAHSMGNRALTRAVTALFTEHPELRGRFKEIILTAPDIDADVFKRDIAPKLVAGCDTITIYVSDGDKALLASKKVHGYPRLGDASTGIVVVPGIETIDASGLDTSFLEHSYFAESGSVLGDIRKLVREGLRAAERGLKRLESGGETYWKFVTDPE